jgi:hypothetical protein
MFLESLGEFVIRIMLGNTTIVEYVDHLQPEAVTLERDGRISIHNARLINTCPASFI